MHVRGLYCEIGDTMEHSFFVTIVVQAWCLVAIKHTYIYLIVSQLTHNCLRKELSETNKI